MQAEIEIRCSGCGRKLTPAVKIDTADMPEDLQAKINKVILAHRANCRSYNEREWAFMEAIVCPGAEEFLRQYRTIEGAKV